MYLKCLDILHNLLACRTIISGMLCGHVWSWGFICTSMIKWNNVLYLFLSYLVIIFNHQDYTWSLKHTHLVRNLVIAKHCVIRTLSLWYPHLIVTVNFVGYWPNYESQYLPAELSLGGIALGFEAWGREFNPPGAHVPLCPLFPCVP